MKSINEKDLVEAKGYMIVNLKQKRTTEPSCLFCDKIKYIHDKNSKDLEYFDHRLMFYNKGEVIFKIWLPNKPKERAFKDIHRALEVVGMKIVCPENLKIEEKNGRCM